MNEVPSFCYSRLSTQELLNLQHHIDCFFLRIHKKKTTNDVALLVEGRMAKAFYTSWKRQVEEALPRLVEVWVTSPFTEAKQKGLEQALAILLKSFASSSEVLQTKITTQLTTIWEESQKEIALELKAVQGEKTKVIKAESEQVSLLQKAQNFWLDNFYNTHLSKRVRGVIADVASKVAGSLSQLKETLTNALSKELGTATTQRPQPSEFAPQIPARYAGNPMEYFDLLAATTGHQDRIFARLMELQKAQIKTYRLNNPMDDRTSEICAFLYGHEFSVKEGVAQMEQILEAEGEKIKEVAPWLSVDQIEALLQGVKVTSEEASAKLTEVGVMLPPFHGRCRTDVVLVN